MRARRATALIGVLAAQLALAAPALAKNGEGWAGELNDKVITLFCLGLVIFFTIVVILGTLIQGRLERRKDQKNAARMRQRVGW